MNNTDPQHLIHHIDSAKTWLDKAKEEYSESNGVGAGMHLNLAQAEVKYAWELSRRQDVSQIDDQFRKDRRNYWMPAAAALVVFALGTVLSLQLVRTPKIGESAIANRSVQPLTGETRVAVEPLQTKPLDLKPGIGQSTEGGLSIAVTGKNSVVASTSKIKKPGSERTSVVQNVSDAIPANSGDNEPIKAVVSNNIENVRTRESSVAVKPQPVSEMSIDEEALTREASNSLQRGK